jgi:hypothetical protein
MHVQSECISTIIVDIDFFIGAPKSLHYRACRETRAAFGWWYFFSTTIPTGLRFLKQAVYSLLNYGTVYLTYYIGNPSDWKVSIFHMYQHHRN